MDSKKPWVDRWYLVSKCFFSKLGVGVRHQQVKYFLLCATPKENEKLSGQNMSTGCPQPRDYTVLNKSKLTPRKGQIFLLL